MPPLQALWQTRLSALSIRPAPTLTPTSPLRDAIAALRTSPTGCVLAAHGPQLKGILTERDYLQRILLHERAPTTTLADVMTPDPLTLEIDETVAHAVELMVTRKVRHLPVTSRGLVRGVIYGKDIIEFIAQQYPAEVMNLPPDSRPHIEVQDGG